MLQAPTPGVWYAAEKVGPRMTLVDLSGQLSNLREELRRVFEELAGT